MNIVFCLVIIFTLWVEEIDLKVQTKLFAAIQEITKCANPLCTSAVGYSSLVQSKARRTEVLAQIFCAKPDLRWILTTGLHITFSLEGSYISLSPQEGWIDALGEGRREEGIAFLFLQKGYMEPQNLEIQMTKLRCARPSTIFRHWSVVLINICSERKKCHCLG